MMQSCTQAISTRIDFALFVADDDFTTLPMLEILFAADGYHILTAAHAQTALSLAEERPVDPALVDLQLPWLDGFRGAGVPR